MKFDDLTLGEMFTFSLHSKEVWEKVSSIHCVLLNYPDEERDEVYSVNQTVFACDVMEETRPEQVCDNFQPMSLIKELKRCMKEVTDNPTTDEKVKQGIRIGLAWGIAEIMGQATAKDRFKPRG